MKTLIVEKVLIQNGNRTVLFAVATSHRNLFSVRTSLTYEAHLTEWTANRELAELQARYIEAPDDGAAQDALMPQIEALQKVEVAKLWSQGKSISAIESALGFKIHMGGCLADIQRNFATGNFQIQFSN